MGTTGGSGLTPQQVNDMTRAILLAGAVDMKQIIFSQTIAASANANPVIVVPRNVGLIKRFIVEITGTATNTDGANASAVSQLGLANLLNNVQFIDLQNNTRINTNGFHLAALKMVKRRRPSPQTLSTVIADKNQMLQVGENFPILAYAAPAHSGNTPFRAVFEIPLAYSDEDLRGAIYANVIQSNMSLLLQINQTAFQAAGSDSTYAMFGNAAGNISNLTVTVYQEYLDQIPIGQNGPVLPVLDLSTVYELKYTNFSAITANQDYPVSFANFRDFLSVFAVYNSAGADGGLHNGSDINTWALQSANFTNIWKVDPLEAARLTRDEINVDLPVGVYYFPSRKKPISTTQYGNMQLVLNAITAAAGAYLGIYWEDFGYTNTLTQAGSLAG